MKIGIFTSLFGDWPLEKVARHVSGLGYEAVELPLWEGNHHVSMKDLLGGGAKALKRMLADNGLVISGRTTGSQVSSRWAPTIRARTSGRRA